MFRFTLFFLSMLMLSCFRRPAVYVTIVFFLFVLVWLQKPVVQNWGQGGTSILAPYS